jgi:glycerol-3-phosphate dehydrogenase (NAD(P)+)
MTTLTVLGSGAWGTAVAIHLASSPGHRVRLWCARPGRARLLREHGENRALLPGVPIPPGVHVTEDAAEATDGAQLWVSAIPTVHLRATLARLARRPPGVVSLTKGIEVGTFARPSQILGEVLGAERVAVLSGPSHAEEVSRGLPTSLVAASEDEELALEVQRHFTSGRLRVYTNLDPVGVELAGALKNIMGLAAGIASGLGLGDNALAALLTRGLAEMSRFGVAHGAEPATFSGLAGLGDLITTCVSPHGRNRRVGQRLAGGEPLAQILQGMEMVAEGVTTTRAAHARAGQMGVEMPITAEVYRVLYEGKPPREALASLMGRPMKGER